jgi:type I restriction enzyme S subunit
MNERIENTYTRSGRIANPTEQVEWKELCDFLNFEQPTPYLVKSTEYDNSYKTPVLTAGQSLLLGYTNELDGIYEADKDNPCIIFDDFTTSFHWIDYSFKVKSSAMKMLKPKANTNFRYVYYAMQQIRFVPQQHQRHWISKYSHFQIPIPSLEEQKRIVGILDTFTDSIENLKQQIAQRRKQYEHYRDQLLDLEGKEGVETKTLGDFCDTLSGFPFDSSKFKDEGIQLMRGANIKRGYFDFSQDLNKYWESSEGLEKYLLKANDIIISMDGSLVGKSFCYLKKEHLPLLLVQRVARIRTKENFKFLYYVITKEFPFYVEKKKTAGAIPHISMKDINSFPVPLPSKIEQQRIVSLLDTFEASISNLEAQLEQRQKQYEYYRNQLLTFE